MNMYSNKLAVAIKHNGKILRETKDVVHLPYGSEFSVLVKNLNNRRVKFTLHIDGTDVLDGTEIIVRENSEAEIKRFIRNGNMDEGNAFKFIERTSEIEDGPRGIKIDDGIVRVEFWFEQEREEIKIKDIYWEKHHYRDYYREPTLYRNGWGPTFGSPTGATGSVASGKVVNQWSNSVSCSTLSAQSMNTDISDVGITVPGSKVEQKFSTVYGFKSEVNSNTIILRLVGKSGDIEVKQAVTVNTKPKCSTCGKLNKSSSKFCSQCGTALELI